MKTYTKREMEIMFCIGLLHQKDLTMDILAAQLELAQSKIDKILEVMDANKEYNEANQPDNNTNSKG